jgi:hypothetical protein
MRNFVITSFFLKLGQCTWKWGIFYCGSWYTPWWETLGCKVVIYALFKTTKTYANEVPVNEEKCLTNGLEFGFRNRRRNLQLGFFASMVTSATTWYQKMLPRRHFLLHHWKSAVWREVDPIISLSLMYFVFLGAYPDDRVHSLVGKAHKISTWLFQLQHKCRRMIYSISVLKKSLLF